MHLKVVKCLVPDSSSSTILENSSNILQFNQNRNRKMAFTSLRLFSLKIHAFHTVVIDATVYVQLAFTGYL